MKVALKNWKKDNHTRLYVKLLGANNGHDVELGYFCRGTNIFISSVNFRVTAIVEMLNKAIIDLFCKDDLEKSLNCHDAKSYLGTVTIELTNEQFIAIKHADDKKEEVIVEETKTPDFSAQNKLLEEKIAQFGLDRVKSDLFDALLQKTSLVDKVLKSEHLMNESQLKSFLSFCQE